ncbi:hypothetical protein [Streptomyces sp. NPDC018055]|uniref:hypothetical protein n=1 Tax=Streptomyces sp. NPDC018055 TaxID=3365038 RepID=UPI0037BB06F4
MATRLTDKMTETLLNAIIRPSYTEDGTTVYQVQGNAGTLKALATRDMVENAARTVTTPGINDGEPHWATGTWLTEDAVTFLREALADVMAKPADDRPAVYREWLNTARTVRAAARFIDPTEDAPAPPVVDAPRTNDLPRSFEVEDVDHQMYVGVLRDDAMDAGVVHAANVRESLKNHAERGARAERLDDGTIHVEYSWFVPIRPTEDATASIEVKRGMYARHTGAHGLGWTRKVCDENTASVRAAIETARTKGHRTEMEANGVIRIDGAGTVDLAHADAGQPCPVWYVPQERPAAEPHGYTWADAREVKARELKPGDVFVKPGTGTAWTTATDGTVRGAGIAFAMELDGTAWTVVSRTADTATCTSHTGQTLTDAPMPESCRVLRVRQAAAPAPVFTREPWRGGQYCGHQTAYGMPGSEFCADRKAPGLPMCQQHHDETAEEYGAVRMAPGNALGDPTVPLVLLWEPMEDDVPVRPTAGEFATYATVNVHIAAEGMLSTMGTTLYSVRLANTETVTEHTEPMAAAALQLAHMIRMGVTPRWTAETELTTSFGDHVLTIRPAADVDTTADDETTPLNEMGTDDLLTVLRENVADIPKGSVFGEAWALMDRILTDGGPECLPAPWDGPAEGTLIPHDADPETLINLGVRFIPQDPADTEGDTRPCMAIGTAQVYGYREGGQLIVGVESREHGPEPMEITVDGNVVFRAPCTHADGTFGVVDNITGKPVRDGGMSGHDAESLCGSLNLSSGPGGRYSVWVIDAGEFRRMTFEERVTEDGTLGRW